MISEADVRRHVGQEIEKPAALELRDYFAAAALSAIVAEGHYYEPSTAALRAYHLADAMIAAREAK